MRGIILSLSLLAVGAARPRLDGPAGTQMVDAAIRGINPLAERRSA